MIQHNSVILTFSTIDIAISLEGRGTGAQLSVVRGGTIGSLGANLPTSTKWYTFPTGSIASFYVPTVTVTMTSNFQALNNGVPLKSCWTVADVRVVLSFAESARSTRSLLARVLAFIIDTGLVEWTIIVDFAFICKKRTP